MDMQDEIFIMKAFPDFQVPGFDMETYNERFKKSNVIIHAKSNDVAYPEHWGCLSIKCAFNGMECYGSGNHFYAVDESNYLIFNEGKHYWSYIFSDTPVDSFTINFSASFEKKMFASLVNSCDKMLDDFQYTPRSGVAFVEKLYTHDKIISPVLSKLYSQSVNDKTEAILLYETYNELLEKLMLLQETVFAEVRKIDAVRPSTQLELYKRLHYAKDYIDSCFTSDISLERLASVAFLNSAYFLRTYRKYFRITPYQYIIQKRLQLAKKMLGFSDMPIAEVCYEVGYQDISSFIKLFKSNCGVTPEKYQQQNRKKSFFTS